MNDNWDNWTTYQEEARRHYLRRKLVWAFILGLITLALLAVAPEGTPFHRDNNRVAGALGEGWDNVKSSFTGIQPSGEDTADDDVTQNPDSSDPNESPNEGENREDNRGVGLLRQGWDNLRSAFTDPQPVTDDTTDGDVAQDPDNEKENNGEAADSDPEAAYPVDSFSVSLPDNATSLTVNVAEADGNQLDLMVDGQKLGEAVLDENGDLIWTPSDSVDTSQPKNTPETTVEQMFEIVAPSVAEQIDATMPLFLAGETVPSSVVVVRVDGDEFVREAADENGNWSAELDLKSLKPGEHKISAETLLNNEILPPTPTYTFDLKESASASTQESLYELILADDELSTLAGAVETAGLQNALIDTEKLTVFAPTNSAFATLPQPIVEALGSNLIALNELLLNHVSAGMVDESGLSESLQTLGGAMIKVEAVSATIDAENGRLYKIDNVLLPPPAITPPVIDTAGVETFKGNFLTIVGTAESNSNLLLTLNGEKFGEAIVSPEGTWGISGDITDGSYDIVAYSYTDDLELAVSETVNLEVEN